MHLIALISKLLILIHDSLWVINNFLQVITFLVLHNRKKFATFIFKKVNNFYNIFMLKAV